MGKPSRQNFDDSSEQRSAPPLSKASGGRTSNAKRGQNPKSRQNASSTMPLLIGGASLLLVMLIVVAVLQQFAMHGKNPVAKGKLDQPSASTESQVADATDERDQSRSVDELPLSEAIPSPSDSTEAREESSDASNVLVAETSRTDVASSPDASPSEAMTEEEPEEVTPEATDPTAADFDRRITRAAHLINEQKGKEAIIVLKQASGAYPKEIRADFYLGLIYSGIGLNEPKSAETHFKRVLDREAGHVAALNNLGLVSINARKYPAARNYFSQALKSDPRPTEVDQNLGRMLNRAKILEIKNDQIKMIASLKPKTEAYQPSVGWLYMPLDRTERSLAEYHAFSKTKELEDRSCCYCQGDSKVTCRTCSGRKRVLATGAVSETRNLGLGAQTQVTPVSALVPCSDCRAEGHVDCPACSNGIDSELRRR